MKCSLLNISQRTNLLLLIVLGIFSGQSSASILLAELYNGDATQSCCGTWKGVTTASEIVGMQFTIGYVSPLQNPLQPNTLSQLIGGNISFGQGATGHVDFNKNNSPAFNEVVKRLSNGLNEPFVVSSFGFNDSGALRGGTGVEVDEHRIWFDPWNTFDPSASDLLDFDIDFFRLSINEINWGSTGTAFSINSDVSWQIYGNPIQPVPEPNILALMMAGFGLIGFKSYRCRDKDQAI